MVATDLEMEVQARSVIASEEGEFEFTLPSKKFIDICKALPENADIEIDVSDEKAVVRAGRSRFTLSTLPAADFPSMETAADSITLMCNEGELKSLIDRTAFAMAQQDVRYYLNGLLLEITEEGLRSVATDGHRLALFDQKIHHQVEDVQQVLIPRKAVIELGRMLRYSEDSVHLAVSSNSIQLELGQVTFLSKLIDGKFPNYERVIPKDCAATAVLEKDMFKQCLTRAAILSNDKYKGVRLTFSENTLLIQANNPEHEQAEEEMLVEYQNEAVTIGFNVSYLLDILGSISSEKVAFFLKDAKSSTIVRQFDCNDVLYVVMPMQI
jgi:DNA polymerase-3 subunit beta